MKSHGSFSHFWKIAFYFIFLLLITVSSHLIELTALVTEVSGIMSLELWPIFIGLPVTKPPNQEKNALLLGLQKESKWGMDLSEREECIKKVLSIKR